jgi:hypothetical protein
MPDLDEVIDRLRGLWLRSLGVLVRVGWYRVEGAAEVLEEKHPRRIGTL